MSILEGILMGVGQGASSIADDINARGREKRALENRKTMMELQRQFQLEKEQEDRNQEAGEAQALANIYGLDPKVQTMTQLQALREQESAKANRANELEKRGRLRLALVNSGVPLEQAEVMIDNPNFTKNISDFRKMQIQPEMLMSTLEKIRLGNQGKRLDLKSKSLKNTFDERTLAERILNETLRNQATKAGIANKRDSIRSRNFRDQFVDPTQFEGYTRTEQPLPGTAGGETTFTGKRRKPKKKEIAPMSFSSIGAFE